MTRDAFINKVVDEITEGGVIPASPKVDRIKTLIVNALKFFREHDDDATEMEYAIIALEAFQTELFKDRRQVKFPDCVEAITNVQRLGNVMGRGNNQIDQDFRKGYLNFALATNGRSDEMLTGVTQQFYVDFLSNFTLRSVAYEYNPYSRMLTITGRDIREKMVAELWVHLPDEAMFEMDRFFRYVVGKCKISFASTFGFIKQKTIGGREIDVETIKADGEELIKEVKEYIEKQKDSVDFYLEYE